MKPKLLRYAAIAAICIFIVIAFLKYRQPRFVAGEKSPDFVLALTEGERIKLSDFQGKYVLLHFWGSWCGPCRKENPQLAALYQRYHQEGFEIMSVGIEQNTQSWQRAIRQDGLAWRYHTMESQDFEGPLSRQFNIRSIPASFLINPEGRIMGVNLKQEHLEKMLAQHLVSR